MNRRQFLKTAAAGAAISMLPGYVAYCDDRKPYRVGLIGSGWYGSSDLYRLIQVAPVEVVSLCDVDKNMLARTTEIVSARQKSKKAPRNYSDYREMLKEKDLDIVLVGSPDHWHSLHMIAAVESGADVYCQKPISHDVLEGEAMVAAARKYNRVVQIGTQRRSTPHLIDAKKKIVESGMLGKVGQVDIYCYYHMRANGNPPVKSVPDFLDYEMWTGPAALRPYDDIPHRRWWRTFIEYSNGIVGDMCVHMLDCTRWMLNLGWPKRVSSTGGIYASKEGKSNISDTQTAVFEFDNLNVTWQHRSYGTAPDPKYPWGFSMYGDKGTLRGSVMSYDFTPDGKGSEAIHQDVVYEREQYPEDVTEKDNEVHVAPATRGHMLNFLEAVEKRTKPVADIEQGHISTASCILANLSMKLGGRPLSYDPVKRIVTNDLEATALLKSQFRGPWKHPADSLL